MVWNHEAWEIDACNKDIIKFTCLDKDTFSSDVIGTAVVRIETIIRNNQVILQNKINSAGIIGLKVDFQESADSSAQQEEEKKGDHHNDFELVENPMD